MSDYEDQLPWLQAVEDERETSSLSAGRMLFALLVVALASAAIGGTFFWLGNREAVGARVELAAPGQRQTRRVLAGDSYASSSERRLLFTWPAEKHATLEVRWPSGRRQRLADPPAGRYLTLFEPDLR